MSNADGNVLVENIFISNDILTQPVGDPLHWPGVLPQTALSSEYANKLRKISSVLPDGYRVMMTESGYRIASGALMMLPGISPELVEMGFVMSMSTPISR